LCLARGTGGSNPPLSAYCFILQAKREEEPGLHGRVFAFLGALAMILVTVWGQTRHH